jgi:hypothetical protein
MRLRKTVQQQYGRTGTEATQDDIEGSGAEPERLGFIEQSHGGRTRRRRRWFPPKKGAAVRGSALRLGQGSLLE